MANIFTALGLTLKHEGGYAFDPADPGGETYCGISRKDFPNWPGWVLVDQKKPLSYNQIIQDTGLIAKVNAFYLVLWRACGGDLINSQRIASALFDWYVTSGRRAIYALQKIVGVKMDGEMGPETIDAVNNGQEGNIFLKFVSFRIDFYRALAVNNPSMSKFLGGWVARAESYT